jgi:hypothetical protein
VVFRDVAGVLVPLASLRASGTGSAFARGHGASFIDYQGPAHQLLAMTGFDCMRSHRIIIDLREAEAASLPRETVAHHGDGIYGNSMIGKEILHIGFVRCVRKISHKKLLHVTLLLVTGGCSRETPGGTERQDRKAD